MDENHKLKNQHEKSNFRTMQLKVGSMTSVHQPMLGGGGGGRIPWPCICC